MDIRMIDFRGAFRGIGAHLIASTLGRCTREDDSKFIVDREELVKRLKQRCAMSGEELLRMFHNQLDEYVNDKLDKAIWEGYFRQTEDGKIELVEDTE